MFDPIGNDLQFLQQSLGLRAHRQSILSSNIANADTPNYKARDFDFTHALKEATFHRMGLPSTQLKLTSLRHISGGASQPPSYDMLYRLPTQPTLDGNTVDMNHERTNFADNSMRYQASLSFISSRIRTLMSAIQE